MTPAEKAERSFKVRLRPATMGCAGGLPVLKRPGQRIPMYVRCIINKKLKSKTRQVDTLNRAKDETLYYSYMEDIWDRQMARIQETGSEGRELSWYEAAENGLDYIRKAYSDNEKRSYVLTKKFQKIIDEDKVRYEEYKRAERKAKMSQRWEKMMEEKEERVKQLQAEWKHVKDAHSKEV